VLHEGRTYTCYDDIFCTTLLRELGSNIIDEPECERDYKIIVNAQMGTLAALALNLAKRFKADNEWFVPSVFLNACSPNTDLYPLSELWEDTGDIDD
jgi:hypothetical protein